MSDKPAQHGQADLLGDEVGLRASSKLRPAEPVGCENTVRGGHAAERSYS
jgi:hypothetical protein